MTVPLPLRLTKPPTFLRERASAMMFTTLSGGSCPTRPTLRIVFTALLPLMKVVLDQDPVQSTLKPNCQTTTTEFGAIQLIASKQIGASTRRRVKRQQQLLLRVFCCSGAPSKMGATLCVPIPFTLIGTPHARFLEIILNSMLLCLPVYVYNLSVVPSTDSWTHSSAGTS